MTLVVMGADTAPRIIARVPAGDARCEHRLRDLIFDHPEAMPVHDLDPSYGRVFAVAKELNVPGVGYIDVLLADERGRLVVVECKLWRNPQARREVVGQILDYARALSRFGYEDLQRQIAIAAKRQGNVLYQMACSAGSELVEAAFVDRVSRDLKAGRFLLLVAGDGITEGTQRIGEFLRDQPGLAFDFGLVEMAEYHWTSDDGADLVVMQPRVLAQTVVIERAVIRNESNLVVEDVQSEVGTPQVSEGQGRKIDPKVWDQWRAFAERFIRDTEFDDPSQPPARIGGLGWMKMPLPGGHWVTLWRTSSRGGAGAYAVLNGSDGLQAFAKLAEDRTSIDQEFVDAGLPPPRWEQKEKSGSIAVSWSAPLPWTPEAEDQQLEHFRVGANQMVNSLRPRLQDRSRV